MRIALPLLLSLLALPALAQTPAFIPVQGVLADADTDEPMEGVRSVVFKLYTDADGTNQVFSETHAVTFTGGAFFVGLGTVIPLDLDLFADNASMYLKVEVDGDTDMPLFPLGSTPYAAHAQSAADSSTLEGLSAQEVANLKVEADPSVNALGKADLSCVSGDIPHYDGSGWYCDGASFESASVSGTLSAGTVSATSGNFSGNVTVATPSMNGHAANKGYVDGAASSAQTAAQTYADKFLNAVVGGCSRVYDYDSSRYTCTANTCFGGAACQGSAFQNQTVTCPTGTTARSWPVDTVCTRN